jgi:PAS domain-containing protein
VTLFVGQAGNPKRQRASEAAGFAAVAIAAVAFIRWWAGLPVLASWGAGFPAMKPVAAACLGAFGFALIYPGRNSRFAVAVGLAAAVLAAFDLFGVDLGINGWVVALALWLGRIISRSVDHVARAIVLGEGAPMRLDETPVAEVNTLMAELRGAAVRRHAAEQDLQASKDQLQASKDRLQLAFDATKLGWWQYDPLRGVGSGDARFKEIFEVTVDEISIEDLVKRVHPDDVERFGANRQAALDPVNPTPYVHHEYRVRRRPLGGG